MIIQNQYLNQQMTSLFKGIKEGLTGDKKDEPKQDKEDKPKDDKEDKDKDATKEEKKKPDAGSKQDDEQKICQMKRGDYMIHIYVEQAKEINVKEGRHINPIVEIKVLGQRKFTKALKGINNLSVANWSEHIFYEKKNVEEEQLAQARIEIKLLDKGFLKDAMIGYYELDLTYIYQQENHAIMHKWVVLSDPTAADFTEVTGYLKLSITVTGAGDNQIPIEDDPNPDSEDMLQPPTIKPEFYQLYIRFFCAQEIVPMDGGLLREEKTDAYVRFDYKSTKLKTKVLKIFKGGEIHWNQEFLVPAQIPIMGGNLNFKVFDEDAVNDELIGSFQFKAKSIIEDLNGKYFWKNIYGSPLDVSGKHTDRMNENPDIGSLWKGRILMQVVAELTEKPILLVRDIETKEINEAAIHLAPKKYQFAIQLISGLSLPEPYKYQVQVRIGGFEYNTDKKDTVVFEENGKIISSFNRFHQNLHDQKPILELPYISTEDMKHVFVYLIKETKIRKKQERICFARLNVNDFLDPNPDVKWIELQPDLAIEELNNDEHYKAGILGIRMTIWDIAKNGGPLDLKKQENWCIPLKKKRCDSYLVRAFCFQARDLPTADESGSSDPFIRITDTGAPKNTRVIFDNVNPIFYQALDCGFEANRFEDMPPVIIDLFDMDVNTVTKNTVSFLSRTVLQLKDILPFSSDGDEIARPKWWPLRFKLGGPTCGEVLMSFSVQPGDHLFKSAASKVNIPIEAGIQMREFNVLMNILGLRHLQSAGILPVKKAFVLFNLKSMVSPDIGNAIENMKTEPGPPGPDPTLNTIIEFDIELPTDELYCPRMACTVYDSVMFGLSQPTIGTFIVPIGDLIKELAEERKRETEALEHIVVRLKEITSSENFIVALRASLRKRDDMNVLMTPKSEDKNILNQSSRFRQDIAKKMKAQRDGYNKAPEVKIQFDDDEDEIQEEKPLLSGDHDEEARMSERIAQAEQNAIQGQQENITEVVKQKTLHEMMVHGQQPPMRTASGRTLSQQRVGSASYLNPVNEKFNPDERDMQLAIWKAEEEKAARDTEEARKKAEAEFLETANIVWPKYEFDEKMQIDREVGAPPSQLFVGLGWDEDKDTHRRHYRRFYNQDLESVRSILPKSSPFNQYDLKRGQTRGAKKSVWASLTGKVKEDESGQVSTEQIVGRFKAVIEVEIKTEKKQYKQRKQELIEDIQKQLILLAKSRGIFDFDLDVLKLSTIEGRKQIEHSIEPLGVNDLDIVQKLADIESDEILRRMLLVENKCVVRVYMIQGFNLASRDIGGESDPYLKLSIGSKVHDDRDNYQVDNPAPKFLRHFDFEAVFPGCPLLQIDVFDYDELFGDDLIGTTCVDLEDRYFLPEWVALKDKPVEYRQIYHPSSAVSQGILQTWIEINKSKVDPEHLAKLYDIRQRPPEEIEIRVCVWNTKELRSTFDDSGVMDVYFRCFFDSRKDACETDTHYRCQTGEASFNYRLLYRLMSDRKDWKFTVQAYDRDFFSSNKILGTITFDLSQAINDVILTKRPLCINKDYYDPYMRKEGAKDQFEFNYDGDPPNFDDTFWIPLYSKNQQTKVTECNGHARLQIDICPKAYAEKNKVGAARDQPNVSPFLPPPVGRLSFSFNPCVMYKQLVGPKLRRKICIWFWTSLCCALFISAVCYFVPIIAGDIMARAI